MKNIYWFTIIFLFTITFSCHLEETAKTRKASFKKITLIEYKLGLNDKEQEYDLILLKLYEINPFLQVKAFDFTKSETPLFKPATQIESTLNSLVESYPTNTKIPFTENGAFYHGPEYFIIEEFESGEIKVIDFSPFRITKDLLEIVNFLETEDYHSNSNLIAEPVNKVVLSNQFEMIIRQRVGIMGYPKIVNLDTIFQQARKNKRKQ